ncbi:uncharacterized protein LOC141559774 [Sminthopsis crassicaudata]|uniref:uncharacterized protein LOC141559774 n=1 Tax=Sminthopsis crassicaudata TaxID=9301 RepID=UPI003D6832CF
MGQNETPSTARWGGAWGEGSVPSVTAPELPAGACVDGLVFPLTPRRSGWSLTPAETLGECSGALSRPRPCQAVRGRGHRPAQGPRTALPAGAAAVQPSSPGHSAAARATLSAPPSSTDWEPVTRSARAERSRLRGLPFLRCQEAGRGAALRRGRLRAQWLPRPGASPRSIPTCAPTPPPRPFLFGSPGAGLRFSASSPSSAAACSSCASQSRHDAPEPWLRLLPEAPRGSLHLGGLPLSVGPVWAAGPAEVRLCRPRGPSIPELAFSFFLGLRGSEWEPSRAISRSRFLQPNCRSWMSLKLPGASCPGPCGVPQTPPVSAASPRGPWFLEGHGKPNWR